MALGASAGGLQAYTDLLEALPPNTGMTFVIVQHLAANHESFLATLLGRATQMPVVEAHDGLQLEPNTVYVIPPNRSLLITDGHLELKKREAGIHLSVDIFFKALAATHGPRAIGVILSGTGSDGMKGIEAIKAAGGTTFAQDVSAQQSGMPQSAIRTGCVDFVMSPRDIALKVAQLASVPELAFSSDPVAPAESVGMVLELVRERANIDFSEYKENTLHRRIRRRMALCQVQDVEAYAGVLRGKPEEVAALAQDILIGVTSFFRDPESFEALKSSVFPRLLSRESKDEPVRVWVVGCSSGEEAYSHAIALLEAIEQTPQRIPVCVFGTDVNAHAIERARRGWFPKSIEEDVSAERLQRFFTPTEGGYSVKKLVRDLCVFAPHNVLTDPPFGRMDLVSCRNLMIYFQGPPQRKLLPLLHYALKPGGVLFLGASESISHHRELFIQEKGRHKIFFKRGATAGIADVIARKPPEVSAFMSRKRHIITRAPRERTTDRQRIAEREALKAFAPPGVLVDPDGDVLQFRGDLSPYVSQFEGRASLNLLKIAREGLFSSVRRGLEHAAAETEQLKIDGIIVKTEEGLSRVSITVLPVVFAPDDRCCWIFFQPEALQSPHQVEKLAAVPLDADTARQISVLTDELMATRDHLELTIQDQDEANEDLQAANEEVQSANEELQSTNEELETSKEEIQSTNEELSTVNEALRIRNEELDRANNDLLNLFSSVDLAVVMVAQDLKIRRYTPSAKTLFNLRESDVGRSIADIRHEIDISTDDFAALLEQAIEQNKSADKKVQSRSGHWHLLRLRPYTADGTTDGAIILLADIDSLAQTEAALQKRVAELAAADRHKNEFLAILAHELRNPLAPLGNAAHMLQRAAGNPAVIDKARALIDRQVNHMARLVGDLLDSARVENGQIKLQRAPLDLRRSIEHVVDLMRPSLESKQQSLRVNLPDEPVWVDGDATRLDQILTNLLSNAHKYTPEQGDIQVTLCTAAAAHDTRHAVIQVVDNGEGIDAELIPRLFELFTQADRSLAHSQGGLGIGLNLVRRLVDMHGGRVSIQSDGPGKGSTFSVRLPVTEAPLIARVEEPACASEVAGRQRRVLLIEDNVDIRESTSELLAMAGFEVTAAASGLEGLEKAAAFGPHAVLLDVGLPDLSGYDVARRLRELPQFATTLMIAMTGYDTPESHALTAAAGFDHHLAKPVNFDDLTSLLLR